MNSIKMLCLILLVMVAIYISGCSRSSPSIVGTWTLYSERHHHFTNNVSGQDTTVILNLPYTVTFTADGHITNNGQVGGTYSIHGDTLITANASASATSRAIITTLIDHALGIMVNDTISRSPNLVYDQVTANYTR